MFVSRLLRAAKPATRVNALSFSRMSPMSRNFHSQTILRSTATTVGATDVAPAEPEGEVEGVINKYGLLPFVGLGAVALVSKEVFVLNEEFLLAVDVCAFVFTAYVMGGDVLNNAVAEKNKSTMAKFDSAFDMAISAVEMYKKSQENLFKEVVVMKEYCAEFEEASKLHATYLTVKPQHDARAAMEAKLIAFKAREDQAASRAKQLMVDTAVANVISKFKADAKAQAEMIDLAIERLGNANKIPEKADPIKKLFLSEL